jgi:phosphatidylinositol alpha-1,6-mannosyltransferase
MVFIEAAACGKPTVAGDAGGAKQAVQDGVTGIVVDGQSSPAIVEAVALVLDGAGGAEQLGNAGYKRVLREFSWDRVAEQTRFLARTN